MRERIGRFMQGRYGNDHLNRFLMTLTILILVAAMFTRPWLNFGVLPGLGIIYYRMLSRKIYKRAEENRSYLRYENAVVSSFKRRKLEWKQRKTHHIYKCPSCKQKIRIPRGKGKIEITCPKCKNTFIKKS